MRPRGPPGRLATPPPGAGRHPRRRYPPRPGPMRAHLGWAARGAARGARQVGRRRGGGSPASGCPPSGVSGGPWAAFSSAVNAQCGHAGSSGVRRRAPQAWAAARSSSTRSTARRAAVSLATLSATAPARTRAAASTGPTAAIRRRSAGAGGSATRGGRPAPAAPRPPGSCRPPVAEVQRLLDELAVRPVPTRRSATVQATRSARSAPRAVISPLRSAASSGRTTAAGSAKRVRRRGPGHVRVASPAVRRPTAPRPPPAPRAPGAATVAVFSARLRRPRPAP